MSEADIQQVAVMHPNSQARRLYRVNLQPAASGLHTTDTGRNASCSDIFIPQKYNSQPNMLQ